MDYDKKSFERAFLSATPRSIVKDLRRANTYDLVIEYLFQMQNSNPSVFIDFSRPIFNEKGVVRIWTDRQGIIAAIECNGKHYK
jgi:hypothetical protein